MTAHGPVYSVRILSETDGKKTLFASEGTLTRSARGVRLTYTMEDSLVVLETDGGEVSMCREGGVFLNFLFRPSAMTAGEIGLSRENAGRVGVFSERVETFLREENGQLSKLTILLEYVLSFSDGESRRMALRVAAQRKNSKDGTKRRF